MQAIVKPGFLQGTVAVPPSKSMMQRACAGALLHKGKTIINNPGKSEDDKAALEIIRQLGAGIIEHSASRLVIESAGIIPHTNTINCGESGLSARLFTPIAALSENEIGIEGRGSLLARPMHFFQEVLPGLEVTLPDFNGGLPFSVKGVLQPRNITIDGSLSSQFLSGLLFAFCYAAKNPVTIEVRDLKSKPYIDLTLEVLNEFGWTVTHEDYRSFYIDPGKFAHKEVVELTIEADWSSAACWLVAAAINGKLSVEHLRVDSVQADKKIVDILQNAGCVIRLNETYLNVEKSSLIAFSVDLSDSPDLFPVAAVLASLAQGTSSLEGLNRLTHKESNREQSIIDMLSQFGVSYRVQNDALVIDGRRQLNGGVINGHHDHRIVMAAAIGALCADAATVITNAESVAKSYPDFFAHLASLDIHCEFKN